LERASGAGDIKILGMAVHDAWAASWASAFRF
jgi:hypothetical protein